MSNAEPFRVIRVKCADVKDGFVVLFVFKRGSAPLDLEIIGSEGEAAFGITVKSSQLSKLKDRNYEGSDADWESALKRILLLETPPSPSESHELENIECSAQISTAKASLNLVWRRHVGEVTQRLGALILEEIDGDPGEKFDLFWGCAAGARQAAEEHGRAVKLQNQVALQEDRIQRLQEQLNDLVKAKAEQEDELLHKFADLLNAKKLKIRDQQRLLASAKLDPAKAGQLTGSRSRTAESSRASKRKTLESNAAASDEESSDGFEKAPSDEDEDPDERMLGMNTPEPLEDETADEDEDKELTPPPETKKGGIKRTIGKDPVTPKQGKGPAKSGAAEAITDHDMVDAEPPPKRELPFGKRNAAKAAEERLSQNMPSQTKSTTASQSRSILASQTTSMRSPQADSSQTLATGGANDDTEDEDDEL